MEAERLQEEIQSSQRQESLRASQKEILEDITATIRALALGEKQDETFYRNMLDKIVVHSKERIDIHLNLLPQKWSYMLSDLAKPTANSKELQTEHFGTSLPFSVRAAECSVEGKNIFAHDPRGKVAAAYESLAQEVCSYERSRQKNEADRPR